MHPDIQEVPDCILVPFLGAYGLTFGSWTFFTSRWSRCRDSAEVNGHPLSLCPKAISRLTSAHTEKKRTRCMAIGPGSEVRYLMALFQRQQIRNGVRNSEGVFLDCTSEAASAEETNVVYTPKITLSGSRYTQCSGYTSFPINGSVTQ
ncbi:hypothetical protein K491DRAFT_679506 [Lophiostoma macrostomum CBS 122681]|uniref:Uncharacterized protein n=1 Tax=Lophiostoma macrostomum CBS 122681 TaxID=1314788 RepID=A0A6A6T786_9PLEO|nr:hypothetical protein K491DRAFT_679506 [Lophiostoma macrostomum CBS 122681]